MKKLFIMLTLVTSMNVFAIDTVDLVRNEIWSKYEPAVLSSTLSSELGDRWSEELEIAVNLLEEH